MTELRFACRGFSVGGSSNAGIGPALDFIEGLPTGHILLRLAGTGLSASALCSFAEAIWRRTNL